MSEWMDEWSAYILPVTMDTEARGKAKAAPVFPEPVNQIQEANKPPGFPPHYGPRWL